MEVVLLRKGEDLSESIAGQIISSYRLNVRSAPTRLEASVRP